MSTPSFKYLLYDPQAKRFTRREALKLLEEYKRLGRDLPLLMDLSVRSSGYGVHRLGLHCASFSDSHYEAVAKPLSKGFGEIDLS
jgi:hypothetical protein